MVIILLASSLGNFLRMVGRRHHSIPFKLMVLCRKGLVGLAFPSISVFKSPPLIQTLIAQNQLTSPVFSFALTTTSAELVVGGTNPSRISGETTWVPVNKVAFWQIPIGTVSVAGKVVAGVGGGSAIVDTGTTLMLGRQAEVASIYAGITGAKKVDIPGAEGLDVYSCQSRRNRRWLTANYFLDPCSTPPQISISLGGHSFPIRPDFFNFGLVPNSSDRNSCVGGIAAGSLPGDVKWILGDAFLGGVYTSELPRARYLVLMRCSIRCRR